MPEYLAPGVYVEETSYRFIAIEGVSTSTAGFVGPTRFGPTRGVPEVLTSYADFARIYGGLEPVTFGGRSMINYLAHAVQVFFHEGGSRAYVARVFEQNGRRTGVGRLTLSGAEGGELTLTARHPGAMGNFRVTFTVKAGPNVLTSAGRWNTLRGVSPFDLVWVRPKQTQADTHLLNQVYFVQMQHDGKRVVTNLLDGPQALPAPADYTVHVLTINVAVSFPPAKSVPAQMWTGLSFHPQHANALSAVFAETPASRATELYVPLIIRPPQDPVAALKGTFLLQQTATGRSIADELAAGDPTDGDLSASFTVTLKGGGDGRRPTAAAYEGDDGDKYGGRKAGLAALADIDDIATVAAPGSTYLPPGDVSYKGEAEAITRALIDHCTQLRYRVAILDTPNDLSASQVREYRSKLASDYAALYYPWIRALDPVTGTNISMPPSGFVAGIWARGDEASGPHKAPSNEVVRTALGLEVLLNKGQQDVLNPEGVNCFRSFVGQGIRLWGARTISSAAEWKYVNVRRYVAYLEHTLDRGTQWAVFESNGQPLWDKVKAIIEDFLFNEWKSDRLMGAGPAEAYFVRCDRSTMTQNDLDNGRLICQVGVALLRPAEFVIFRIGQWTASK